MLVMVVGLVISVGLLMFVGLVKLVMLVGLVAANVSQLCPPYQTASCKLCLFLKLY